MTNENKTSALAAYGDFSIEEAEAEQKSLKRRDTPFVKLVEGKNRVRFIPPLAGQKWCTMTKVHYVDVPGEGRKNFVCPATVAGRTCPVCAQVQRLLSKNNEADKKKAYSIKAKQRYFANVIDRNEQEPGKRAKVFAFGYGMYKDLLDLRTDEDGGNFVHPFNGFDILIKRSGTGANDTEYKVSAAGKAAPTQMLEDEIEMDAVIRGQADLSAFTVPPTDEELAALLGIEQKPARAPVKQVGAGDDDDDDAPAPRRAQRAGRKTAADAIGEPETVDADWDDE